MKNDRIIEDAVVFHTGVPRRDSTPQSLSILLHVFAKILSARELASTLEPMARLRLFESRNLSHAKRLAREASLFA